MVTTKLKIVMIMMILVVIALVAAYWILGFSSERNIIETLKLGNFATDMGAAGIAVMLSSVI